MAHELELFLRQMENGLADEYRRISSRATEDPGTAGDEGEENWAHFLRSWLPSGYSVVTKGRILGVDGDASPQVDVLVLKAAYPPVLLNKKMYLAGGVATAFECKTTLKKHHLEEALETAAAIQAVADPGPPRSTRRGTPYEELHGAVLYGLLAHSHSWSPSTAVEHVSEVLNAGLLACEHPRNLLDLVCVADLATWHSMRSSYHGPVLNVWYVDQFRDLFPGGYASATVFGPTDDEAWPRVEGEFPDIPVAQLCAQLTGRRAWEDAPLRPIADYFRVTGMLGRGRGIAKPWNLDDVYSEPVAQALRSGRIEQEFWSKWRLAFV